MPYSHEQGICNITKYYAYPKMGILPMNLLFPRLS